MSPFRGSVPFTDDWKHFDVTREGGVATITFNRPDKLNALTFEGYADLRDFFAELPHRDDTRVVVLRGEGRSFCSGGDVDEIIGATLQMRPDELLSFTRMTGEVVRAMRESPVPVIAAIHGTAAGAGSVLALAADFRIMTRSAKFAFLFTKVGLAGADMGAAYLLPRLVGRQNAAWVLLSSECMTHSLLFASGNTLGWFAPLSTAPQPSSVSQTGLLPGTHAVGVAERTPPTRLWCALPHQPAISLNRQTQGSPYAPSPIGDRAPASRSAADA